jgi:hypothetical protein
MSHHGAVDDRSQGLAPEVPVGDEAGAHRRQGVGALDAQHRAGVGVAEVVQPVVVADRVAGDVVAGLLGRDVAAGSADDDDDLALVVQPPAALGAHDGAAVGVQRGHRLVEVRRGRGELGHELLGPARVVEVDRDDLARLGRREVDGVVDADLAPVGGHQQVAVAPDLDGAALEQDAAILAHQPAAVRSGPPVWRT